MKTLVDEFALAHGRTGSRWFRGWADARMGAPRDGYQRIRDAYEENVHLGMLAGASETLGYATEALLLAGDLDAAQKQLNEALHMADQLGERVYLPQLHLLEAAICSRRGDHVAADAASGRAVAEARAQEAPWLELIALTDWCARGGATEADGRALAALIDQLPEGRDTRVADKARAVLEEIRSA
jgi:ATP/maltotriose-dependent transcriptional regulator MalT